MKRENILGSIKPLDLPDPRQAMVSARSYLRELIYDNTLPAGAIISQVELANALGVSRTPLREALRMLQEEGLIVAEANRRCRVAGFSPQDLDAVYSGRLLLEALAMKITLPQLKSEDLDELDEMLVEMEALEKIFSADPVNVDRWRELHQSFHLKMAGKAPAALLEEIRSQVVRCERYLVSVVTSRPFGSIARHGEHRQLVELIRKGQFDEVVLENARHRARTAILLLAETAFDFEPVSIRSAMRMLAGETEGSASIMAAA